MHTLANKQFRIYIAGSLRLYNYSIIYSLSLLFTYLPMNWYISKYVLGDGKVNRSILEYMWKTVLQTFLF